MRRNRRKPASTPTTEEILKKLLNLPPHLQKAVRDALGEEVKDFSSTLPAPREAAAPVSSPPPPPWVGTWPGYKWYLERAAVSTLMDIVRGPNYYRLSLEERAILRRRLGWTEEDVQGWRDSAPLSFGGRTGLPGPEGPPA